MKTPKCRVYATSSSTDAICRSAWKSLGAPLRSRIDLRYVATFDRLARESVPVATDVLVVSRIDDLPLRSARSVSRSSAASQRRTKYLLLAGDAPPELIGERLPALRIQDPRRLLVTGETNNSSLAGLVARCVRGIASGPQQSVLSAAWEFGDDPRLVVTSSTFERLRVPLARLERYLGRDRHKLSQFEIDIDGAFLYWPHAEVHLGWEQFEAIVDPAKSLSSKLRRQRHHQRYGSAMRAFREAAGLRQSDIVGIDPRTVGRVERGEISATSKTLATFAKAHGMSIDDYLNALAERASAD